MNPTSWGFDNVFDELLATSGVVEHCELNSSSVGILAIHGGLEAGTYEIASEVARRSNASLYCVVQPDDLQWHVPSHRYLGQHSANLAAFCEHVDIAISLHGYGGVVDHPARWTTCVLGGARRDLAHSLGEHLSAALGHSYCFISDLESIPVSYRGVHPENPVNRTRGGGVQIELPPRIRGNSPQWHDAVRNEHGFVSHTETLVETLAQYAQDLARLA